MVVQGVARAFTRQEMDIIRQRLKAAARRYAVTQGMRKTTVDELAVDAGISKGAFYKFYPTKEMLFFEIMEDMHAEVYGASAAVLEKNACLPASQRAAQAVLTACGKMAQTGMMDFMERDVALLLRKIPMDVQEKHFHSDEEHIKLLLQNAGLSPEGGAELAASTVRGLFLTIAHRDSIGELYPQVLELLVKGACRQLFPED